MRKDNGLGGVEGYHLPKTMTAFDGPLVAKIHAGKKKTFLDGELLTKAHVPDAKYGIDGYDWSTSKKPNFNKEFRHTIFTDA